ncbi:MAG: Gfo/Idh/MocA family oxidoreductase [Bacteroidales bacterium]|nr:Gfo/Idh/MocA family oxidoreductase [Bacteroidales bacterium]
MASYPSQNQRSRIRIGMLGLGARGRATLRRMLQQPRVEVVALCDPSSQSLERSKTIVDSSSWTPKYFPDKEGWRRVCEDPKIDLVIISTQWAQHAPMAIYAMKCQKTVAVEVPAAVTVQECWELVETSRLTGMECFMMENCCFDPFALNSLELCRQGLLGELTHCEGAYIHQLYDTDHSGWMTESCMRQGGNPYPTHGLGPICHLLDINRSDRLDYLVSLSAEGSGGLPINTTLLHTKRGRSIVLQFDISTPRPYNRLQIICGTQGFIRKYPTPTVQIEGHKPLIGSRAERLLASTPHPLYQQWAPEGERLGVDNMMNYLMDCHLVSHMLDHKPLAINVTDAALWSSIAPLSAYSASQGSCRVEIPDFTGGLPW